MPRRQDIWLLITAHPDDESMFFIPTLRNILSRNRVERNNGAAPRADGHCRRPHDDDNDNVPIIQLLCLSNGDYRDVSDGPIRAREMHDACSLIGVPNGKNNLAAVTVLDDSRMKDGPNEVWSCDLVSETVLEHIRKRVLPAVCTDGIAPSKPEPERDSHSSDPNEEAQSWVFMEKKTGRSSKSEKLCAQSINLNILTFDQSGVSKHPNHTDIFRGIRYLLDGKCNITRDESEPMAKLWMCHGGNASDEGTANNIIEFNISAYTLRTISNPLQKYLLWAFVDILPYLFVWLFQTVRYLLYLLVGGSLWNNGDRRIIQPFSGMKTTPDGRGLQYRIMDPTLVWRAMAAHRSQFVWYRRLSVMFSRYTYINDLEKLTVDVPRDEDHDEEDDVASLPPVVTIGEAESSPEFLLTPPRMDALREAVLPAGLRHRPWKRVYSSARDGDSFAAFRRLVGDWCGGRGDRSTLLVVRTAAGEVIGGFADGPVIPPTSNNVGTAARSCLFNFPTRDAVVKVYGKHCSSSKRILFSASRRIVAFGGGDGGSDHGFGLCLEDGFARGTTARCAAFRNEPLVSDRHGVFEVLGVEVWGFVFGQF